MRHRQKLVYSATSSTAYDKKISTFGYAPPATLAYLFYADNVPVTFLTKYLQHL